MTHHNIAGSEVGVRRPPIYLREIKSHRPSLGRALLPIAAALALPAYVVDQLVGFPICVLVIVAGFLAYVFKPERR